MPDDARPFSNCLLDLAPPDIAWFRERSDIVLVPIAISLARQLSGLVDHWVDLVNLVEVVHTLQQAGNALQTHAGVDVLTRQRTCDVKVVFLPDDGELLLHEDQVPDLQEAIFIDDRAAIWAILGTAVEPDLAARPTGAWNAHVPVVVE